MGAQDLQALAAELEARANAWNDYPEDQSRLRRATNMLTALSRENAALREALENIAWATPEKTAFAADKLWEIQSATARAALAQADTVGTGEG